MKSLRLTIAVPVYNGGEPLMEAIGSCVNVLLPQNEYEILIVDNCSTDGYIDLLNEKFPDLPIRIEKNEYNYGRINNWNRCIDLANGKVILYLFANDLISANNGISDALVFFEANPGCGVLSAPWYFSDFAQTFCYIEPEFAKRTPGIGAFEAASHIKSVIEQGKLPFVCLQSCFLNLEIVKMANARFDENIPLTTDGVFLSAVAIYTGIAGFIEEPTMIFRYDAPNRQHSKVKLEQHLEQMHEAFYEISKYLPAGFIDLSKSITTYTGLENMVAYFLRHPGKKGIDNAWKMFSSWRKMVKKSGVSKITLAKRLVPRYLLFPLKLFRHIKNKFLPK